MQNARLLILMLVSALLLAACASQSVTLTPPGPNEASNGVQVLPVSNGTASGIISFGSTLAIAAALSASPDRTAKGFGLTTIDVGAGTTAGTFSLLRSESQMVRSTVVPLPGTQREAHRDDAAVLQRLANRSVYGASGSIVRPAESTIPSSLIVGSTVAYIWASKFSIAGTGDQAGPQFLRLPSTLEAQTPHANIWIDNTLLLTPSFSGGGALSNGSAIGSDFEVAYTSDTTHFASSDYAANAPGVRLSGMTCDATGKQIGTGPLFVAEPADKRINVVVLNAAGSLGVGVGGFFTALNFASQAALNCDLPTTVEESNEAPMIYVAWSESNGAAFEISDDLVSATAHEFQHLINFVNHDLLMAPPSNSQIAIEQPFINEGLSMLAQDFAINTKYPGTPFDSQDALALAEVYLAAPQHFSTTGFIGVDPPGPFSDGVTPIKNCKGCYGANYLFERYMHDRFGGDAYAHSMETSGQIGFANLVTSCRCRESAVALLQNFEVAMAVNTAGVRPANPVYAFGTLDLTGSYPSPVAGGTKTTLTGVNRILVPRGKAVAGIAPLGGVAYFALQNASGEAVSITDTKPAAGFALTGALVQR